jgi:CRP-like cAMP-binding protein
MIISRDMLSAYHAQFMAVHKDEFILYEHEQANFYFQVMRGSVRMSSYSADGQEFIQGIFKAGESFGEPAIFGDFPYPNNAIAMEDSEIARLPKEAFLQLLKEHFNVQMKFNRMMAHRLRYKAMVLKEISSYQPDHIIITMLRHLRDHSKEPEPGYIPYTRQQIADMTGLRVETVIRTVKKLQKEGKLTIEKHKIYLR